jgi:glycerol-3-phosphate acyltransferase PlsX
MRRELMQSGRAKLGALLAKPTLRRIRSHLDYAEYGGAPLLGVDGVCIIGHGSSSPKAIRNALRVAAEFAAHRVNDRIREELEGGRSHGRESA